MRNLTDLFSPTIIKCTSHKIYYVDELNRPTIEILNSLSLANEFFDTVEVNQQECFVFSFKVSTSCKFYILFEPALKCYKFTTSEFHHLLCYVINNILMTLPQKKFILHTATLKLYGNKLKKSPFINLCSRYSVISKVDEKYLNLLVFHVTNDVISRLLCLSIRTVESKIYELQRKLGFESKRELINWCSLMYHYSYYLKAKTNS